MRLSNFIASFFLLAFAFTLPIQRQGLEEALELVARLNGLTDLEFSEGITKRSFDDELSEELSKRENTLLTEFMTQLNTSGTGVQFVRYFATNSLSQPTTISAIVGFLKSHNLTGILTGLDSSNLGVDIFNEVLSHTDAFDGLVTVGKAMWSQGTIGFKKREEPVQAKRSILGDIVGGIGGLITGGTTTSTTDAAAAVTTTTAAAAATNPLSPVTSVAGDVVGGATSALGAGASQATSALGAGASQVASVVGAGASQATSAAGNVIPASSSASTSTSLSTGSSGLGGLLGDLLGGVTGTVQNATESIGGTIANTTDNIIGSVTSSASDIIGAGTNITNDLTGLSLPSGLDATEVAIFTKLLSFASDSDINDFMVSLDKSGLGSSIIYDALTDSDMQEFVEKLGASIKSNEVWTFSIFLNALFSTNFLTNTIAKIFASTQYTNTLINFIWYFLFNFWKYL